MTQMRLYFSQTRASNEIQLTGNKWTQVHGIATRLEQELFGENPYCQSIGIGYTAHKTQFPL